MRLTRSTFAVFLIVAASLWVGSGVMLTSGQAPSPTAPVTRQRIDVSKLGPQVGERVPGFTLRDQTGETRTLQSIMGPNGAMLVFYRSADW